MNATPRLALPFLAPGQMQKEWFHNEALGRIDMLIGAVVDGPPQPTPPAQPVAGACFIIAAGATGEWAGQEGAIACYGEGGWRFVAPTDGLRAMVRGSGEIAVRRNGSWEVGLVHAQSVEVDGLKVLGARQPGVAPPTGGQMVDAQAREAIAGLIAALSAHGLIGG